MTIMNGLWTFIIEGVSIVLGLLSVCMKLLRRARVKKPMYLPIEYQSATKSIPVSIRKEPTNGRLN